MLTRHLVYTGLGSSKLLGRKEAVLAQSLRLSQWIESRPIEIRLDLND